MDLRRPRGAGHRNLKYIRSRVEECACLVLSGLNLNTSNTGVPAIVFKTCRAPDVNAAKAMAAALY